MNNSKYFVHIEDARQFEQDAKQMFEYATDKKLIDASIYFMKGAELMQQYYMSRSVIDAKKEGENK